MNMAADAAGADAPRFPYPRFRAKRRAPVLAEFEAGG
jgi:hypothetical protein